MLCGYLATRVSGQKIPLVMTLLTLRISLEQHKATQGRYTCSFVTLAFIPRAGLLKMSISEFLFFLTLIYSSGEMERSSLLNKIIEHFKSGSLGSLCS